jgi:hypothetical protein
MQVQIGKHVFVTLLMVHVLRLQRSTCTLHESVYATPCCVHTQRSSKRRHIHCDVPGWTDRVRAVRFTSERLQRCNSEYYTWHSGTGITFAKLLCFDPDTCYSLDAMHNCTTSTHLMCYSKPLAAHATISCEIAKLKSPTVTCISCTQQCS